MRTIAILTALELGACNFTAGVAPTDAKAVRDVQIDGIPVPLDGRACFGSGAFTVCLTGGELTSAAIGLAGNINTDSDLQCLPDQPSDWAMAGQPAACFIVATTIGVGAVTASGGRPLVLVATDTLEINALLDVSSHIGGMPGPGSPSSLCQLFPFGPGTSSGGGGGGAGASFMTTGGNGGMGDNSNVVEGQAPAADTTAPTVLRAGCAGQIGGDGSMNAGGSAGGGGAVYVVAGNAITFGVGGVISASGAAGSGGGNKSGGGGGGSGGMIVLSAPAIMATMGAVIMANGGGGASGGDMNSNGQNGSDPDPTAPTNRANAGSGPGGNGGKGYASATDADPGIGGDSNEGGGGGGGGGGYIVSNVTISNVTASPAVTVIP